MKTPEIYTTVPLSPKLERSNGDGPQFIDKHPSRLEMIVHKAEIITHAAEELTHKAREKWGKGIEFLMSCISMSVGLGNIWRFPYIAQRNGGGAFLIPYIVTLICIGKPIYFMETLIGQFSSKGSIKVYDMAPIMRGVGVGQVLAIGIISTYYSSIMALTLRYMYESFSYVLPWGVCKEEWGNLCIPAYATDSSIYPNNSRSSAELYLEVEVRKSISNIDDGIGYPDLSLAFCLAIAWLFVLLTIIKGVKSSGKASYFLALFPYVVLSVLLVRSCTLPGAWNGIKFFLEPDFSKLTDPKVWYEAVTQCFISLAVCFGCIIMYSSFNEFSHNIHRDVTIITSIDLFTSMFAGITVFGIMGHLAYKKGTTDINSVVKGGDGLAFISYPEALTKLEWAPQVFAVLFFFMLFVLGIGSNVAMTSCVMTAIRDKYKWIKNWQVACVLCTMGFLAGLLYITPGGSFMLNLVDYYGVQFITYILAIGELLAIAWMYGTNNLCRDANFMLKFRPNFYWKACWTFIAPSMMTVIFIYSMVTLKPMTLGGIEYPKIAHVAGWCLTAFGILQLPLWAMHAVYKQKGQTLWEKIVNSTKPSKHWGPLDAKNKDEYKEFISLETVTNDDLDLA